MLTVLLLEIELSYTAMYLTDRIKNVERTLRLSDMNA